MKVLLEEKDKLPRYVIHKHLSKRPHYDFRFESGRKLLSWALPKGMPEDIGSQKLAIKTDDHSLNFLDFEGKIPEGEYGAGKMEIADSGTIDILKKDPENKYVFFLDGEYKGRYALIHSESDRWFMTRVR